MSTSPSTTSLERSPEIFSDPEVKIKEYTALAPYVWEMRQIEILDHYLPLYKMNKTVGQHTALLDKSFWKMKAKRDITDSEVSSLQKASSPYMPFTLRNLMRAK